MSHTSWPGDEVEKRWVEKEMGREEMSRDGVEME
jgi:hypothetical protein